MFKPVIQRYFVCACVPISNNFDFFPKGLVSFLDSKSLLDFICCICMFLFLNNIFESTSVVFVFF